MIRRRRPFRESDGDLKDFLKTLQFIAPQGFEIDYFIMPNNERTEKTIPNSVVEEKKYDPNTTTVYIKKDLSKLCSGEGNPVRIEIPPPIPKTTKTTPPVTSFSNVVNGGRVDSPLGFKDAGSEATHKVKQRINEAIKRKIIKNRLIEKLVDTEEAKMYKFIEQTKYFPKNTIAHFSKKRKFKEAELNKNRIVEVKWRGKKNWEEYGPFTKQEAWDFRNDLFDGPRYSEIEDAKITKV